MGKRQSRPWIVSDELWSLIEPLLPEPGPKLVAGRPRVPDRQALCGILFVLHTTRTFGPRTPMRPVTPSRQTVWHAGPVHRAALAVILDTRMPTFRMLRPRSSADSGEGPGRSTGLSRAPAGGRWRWPPAPRWGGERGSAHAPPPALAGRAAGCPALSRGRTPQGTPRRSEERRPPDQSLSGRPAVPAPRTVRGRRRCWPPSGTTVP